MKFKITPDLANKRLDVVLSEKSHLGSRSRVAKLIKNGDILLNGKEVKPSQACETGQVYTIPGEQEASSKDVGLAAEDIPLNILYEDKDVIVVDKQAGLVMHPAAGHAQGTLVNALIHHCDHLSMGTGEKRPGIVHRLDKDTSGVLVVAKNNFAHDHIAQQFKQRTTHRVYLAVVYGHVNFEEKTIVSHFVRHPKNRKKYISEERIKQEPFKGRKSITHLKTLFCMPNGLSLIQCQLETGRTHQIRIHTSELGHPIVGDNIYGSSNRANQLASVKLRKQIKDMNRIALHAAELGFEHPTTGERMSFSTPWPEDLVHLWSGIL